MQACVVSVFSCKEYLGKSSPQNIYAFCWVNFFWEKANQVFFLVYMKNVQANSKLNKTLIIYKALVYHELCHTDKGCVFCAMIKVAKAKILFLHSDPEMTPI